MSSNDILMMTAIALYLLGMLGIGIYFSKKNEDAGDFYLGGRTLGPFVTAMSAEASDMSSWLLMGLPGVAYLSGVASASWTAIGLAIGTYVNWLLIAKRIRTYTHQIGAITIPEFFSKRYHDKKNILNFFAAVMIIIFFIPYTASGFAACGKLFSTLFGVDYFRAMIVSAAVIVGYTALGGFLAASTTDLIQSIIMSIALVVILWYGTYLAGGVDSVISNAKSMPGYLSFLNTYEPEAKASAPYNFLNVLSTFAWGLGYFGMPHILLRFMAIGDKNKLTLSRRVATIWVVISLGVAVIIGIVGSGMTANGTIPYLEGATSETIIVKIAHLLSSHGSIFSLLAGLILAGILAATMSTADSQLLAASSGVSQNIARDFLKIQMSEKKAILISRLTVLSIAVIGIVLAADPDNSVFEIVSFAWGGFGATFGPVVLCALFWKNSNKYGALAGLLAGAVMIFLWKYAIRPMGGLWDTYELLPAFLFALLAVFVVSKLTGAPEHAVQEEYDRYKANLGS
ncbi:MAG: sodium/proline symporter [Hornefia sp.]|nr:sodium/proline symporter [Hornefia sp.]